MQKLRKLALIAALCTGCAVTVYADDPCAPIPGQTNTPPCAVAQQVLEDDTVRNAAPASPRATDSSEYIVNELALDVVEKLLTLF